MDSITIKRGDTLQFTCSYKQDTDGTPVNLSSFVITVSIIDDNDFAVIEVNSNAQETALRTISMDSLTIGKFTVSIKDTEVLVDDVYYIDFKLISNDNVEQSSMAIRLNVKGKLV